MTIDHILAGLYVFSLAAFLGYQIISKVPQLLHTPLMAFTNAISGISLVASLLIAGRDSKSLLIPILGAVAVASATINVVGGFVITDRMLKMFKKKGAPKGSASLLQFRKAARAWPPCSSRSASPGPSRESSTTSGSCWPSPLGSRSEFPCRAFH